MSLVRSVARISYEVNRAYCNATGDVLIPAGPPWDEADAESQRRYYAAVRRHFESPESTPEENHEAWRAAHAADGWTLGPVKDSSLREHPCMVPWAELPEQQRVKAALCKAVCMTARDRLEAAKSHPKRPTFYSSHIERFALAYDVAQLLSVEEWVADTEEEMLEQLRLLQELGKALEPVRAPAEGEEPLPQPAEPDMAGHVTQEWLDIFKIVHRGVMVAHGIVS